MVGIETVSSRTTGKTKNYVQNSRILGSENVARSRQIFPEKRQTENGLLPCVLYVLIFS